MLDGSVSPVLTHDVFISHSSRDATLAEAVRSRLEQRGISAWISTRDIRPGEDYASAIIRGIEDGFYRHVSDSREHRIHALKR